MGTTLFNKTVWVIMSKDRKIIAKGTPRNRCLVEVSKTKDRKRILTYSSEAMAVSGYTNSWFYTWDIKHLPKQYTEADLEAVPVEMTMIIKGGK